MTCLLLDVWQNIRTYHNHMVILETQGFWSTRLLVVVSCRKQLVFVHNLLHINLLRASSLLAWIPALSVGHKLCLSEEFATRGYGLNSSYLDYVFQHFHSSLDKSAETDNWWKLFEVILYYKIWCFCPMLFKVQSVNLFIVTKLPQFFFVTRKQ